MVERIGEDSEDHAHQSSDSDESDSGTTSQESSESNEDEDCRDEEAHEGSSSFSDENTVEAHGIKWLFREGVVDDTYKDQQYKPVLRVGNPDGVTELDLFQHFFPGNEVTHILQCTNANLPARKKNVTKGDLFKVFGILYAMTMVEMPSRRGYWSTDNAGLFPAPAFGERFGMGYHRFEDILTHLAFDDEPETDNDADKWWQVRRFVEACNQAWVDAIKPGYKLTVDESMFAWYGKGDRQGGMPKVIKIRRKPKGIGCEAKTVADALSGIMVGLELNEGKEAMAEKRWHAEHGATTATTLRLTEPWFGSGRVVAGDSWFASVKTALQLRKHGLHFLGVVKTAHRQFPLKALKERCPENRGAHVVAASTIEDVDLLAVGWRDKAVHTIVGTCGTTIEGESAKKRRVTDTGEVYYKQVPRPKVVQDYHEAAPALDVHNHIRQDGLALEKAWGTHRWYHRVIASLLGIIECNAYLAFNYFRAKEQRTDHVSFTQALAEQLINNPWLVASDCTYHPGPSAGRERSAQDRTGRTSDPTPNRGASPAKEHKLSPLRIITGKPHCQRMCTICRSKHHRWQKASYFCASCGPDLVLCGPTTGRLCYQEHIQAS